MSAATVFLGIIKAVIFAYDFITIPIYCLIQKPWKVWLKDSANNVWAASITDDPSGPYIRKKYPKPVREDIFQRVKNLNELFENSVRKYADKPCFGTRFCRGLETEEKSDGKKVTRKILSRDYRWMTYREVDKKVEELSRSFWVLGVRQNQPVVILADTRMEWMLSALAIFRLGGIVATLYPTLGEDGIVCGINETEVSIVVTIQELLPKLEKTIPKTPKVKTIVCIETFIPASSKGFPEHVKIVPFSHFEHLGEDAKGVVHPNPSPDDVAVIMYTSGSTGIPKGVLLAHSCLLAAVTAFLLSDLQSVIHGRPFPGYLPLSHIFEFSIELLTIGVGECIGYSSPTTLTAQSLAIRAGDRGDLELLKPRSLIAVPVLLDRIKKNVTAKIESKGDFAKQLFEFAMRYHSFWRTKGFKTPLMDKIAFGKIRSLIGGHLEYILSGGAPLSPDTQEWARICLGIRVIQGYGATETSACGTIMHHRDSSTGVIGPPAPGHYLRLIDWEDGMYRTTDKPNPRGEIVIGGKGVSKGYFKNDQLTKESFFEDNGVRWFYTGDIGEILPSGSVRIIDRKKGLVKLQFGEYVSLGKVESELKTCSLIENICVLGNSFSTFVIALIAPNQSNLISLGNNLGRKDVSFQELCDDPDVTDEVTRIVKEHAVKCNLLKMEIPEKVKLCHEDWTPENGLVTATFKVRRKFIEQFYQKDIERLYGKVAHGTSDSNHC